MRAWFLIACALPLIAAAQAISFLPPQILARGGAGVVGTCSGCVALADFNGDGRLDIAFNLQTPLPQGGVLLGNGDGTFRPGLPLSYPAIGPLLEGDFNGDGKPDLLSNRFSIAVYLGKGDGTFNSPVAVGGCAGGSELQVGDFNRDGRTDILCDTTVLLASGDGSFRNVGAVGSEPMEIVVLVADFNGDKVSDVLLRRPVGELAVALGRGDGTFANDLAIDYATFSLRPDESRTIVTGDFNGDGKADLIDFSYRRDHVEFVPGKGDGTFGSLVQTDISADGIPGELTAVGDFNKDGNLDFVAGDAIYAGEGDGTFRFPVFFGPTAYPCGPALTTVLSQSCAYSHDSTAAGDFNGDGLPDIVVYLVEHFGQGQIKESGEVDMLLNDNPGDGFEASGVSAVTYSWPVGPGSIVSAFGVNLASTTVVASTNPAPDTLGGIRLHVRDRSHIGDRLAPLLYVSPTQINYVLNSSDPYAWVDIERIGAPYMPHGITVPIAAVAPGFFPATYMTNAPGYLSLYGTGFAQVSASASVCTVGDVNVAITYVGPEIVIAGLDQVNLLLPASLAGAGVQPVSCNFETAQQSALTNTVNVTIR
jgi:uncharacterized protein (TIGR03437 family)